MAKIDELINHVLDIAERMEDLKDTGALKLEYVHKMGCSERTIERVFATAKKLNALLYNEALNAKQKERMAELAEHSLEGTAKMIKTLIDMANGHSYNEKTKHTAQEGTITYREKIANKEQQNAIKLMKEYKELW